jgi:hypothetical protein
MDFCLDLLKLKLTVMKTNFFLILFALTIFSCEKKATYACSCEFKDDVGNQYETEKILEDYTEKKAKESCSDQEESLKSVRHDVYCKVYLK